MSIVDRLVHKTNVPLLFSLSPSPTMKESLFLSGSNPTQVLICFPLFTPLLSLQEKIDSATDVLKGILKPVVDDVVEIQWPPRDPESLKLMEKVSPFSFCLNSLLY